MVASKTASLTLRIDPAVKERLRLIAEQEHRSLANMVEVMIRDYCAQNGLPVPEPKNRSANAQ
nr:ribbon-helix-helix protein, CopG family [uncultured Halomonas sp.]